MFLLAFEYEYEFEFNELTGFELNLEHVYTNLSSHRRIYHFRKSQFIIKLIQYREIITVDIKRLMLLCLFSRMLSIIILGDAPFFS